MRRSEKEVADPRVVLDVLARGEVLRLAMIADGRPYLVPLSYAALPGPGESPLAGLRVFVHGAPEGRKISALRHDPRVCIEVTVDAEVVPAGRACDFTVRYRSIIAEGLASFLVDGREKAHALSLIAARYARAPAPVDEAQAAKMAVVEIAVHSITCKVSPAPAA